MKNLPIGYTAFYKEGYTNGKRNFQTGDPGARTGNRVV